MAFINELIPEGDKARIDWSKFDQLPLGKNFDRSWWTVDKENGVFLVRLARRGPAGTWPDIFVLSWKGTLFVFELEGHSQGDFASGIEMFWKVLRFDRGNTPECDHEIQEAFKEAIRQYGWNYNCQGVQSVHVEFA
jgi:hypothetical protein